MRTRFAFQNTSYLVAIVFTIGCTTLVVNAFLAFMPFVSARFELPYKIVYVEAILSLFVCVLFLTGSFLAYLKAVNTDSKSYFGWRLEQCPSRTPTDWSEERGSTTLAVPKYMHHYGTNKTIARDSEDWDPSSRSEKGMKRSSQKAEELRGWKLFPAAEEMRTNHLHDVGFLSSTISLCSSFLYCSASLASLVSLLSTDKVAHWIRILRLIAAVACATSSAMSMLKKQKHWWRPAAQTLGWHIGLWNFIGSCGFIICAVLGIIGTEQWAQYQLYFSYFWGSWAFLVGSVIQWYEALHKYLSVEALKEWQ